MLLFAYVKVLWTVQFEKCFAYRSEGLASPSGHRQLAEVFINWREHHSPVVHFTSLKFGEGSKFAQGHSW